MAKDIEPKLKLISDYLQLETSKNFVIPEYQRGYSWNITHCDKLWQDIEDFIESDASDPYFFGTIIVDCSTEDRYSLIDGQQRTTTFLLLLKALFLNLKDALKNLARDESSEALEEGLKESRNKIITILYKADVEKRIDILKDWTNVEGIVILENNSINEQHKSETTLIIEAQDYDTAEKLVYKFPRKQKDNKYTNYFRNFKFFYGKLKEMSESQLNRFARIFLDKCQIIEIRSWQIEQAITMFNSLNSTGLPLSDADIISAQMYSKAGEFKDDFNSMWQAINKLTAELNIRKITNIDAVLQQFMYINRAKDKEYIKDGSVDVTTPGLRRYYLNKRGLLDNPLEICEELMGIAEKWDIVKDFPLVKLLLKFNENAKLYLSSYLYRFKVDEIDREEVNKIAENFIRLFTVLELVDTGYSSKNFKTFLFSQNIKLVNKEVSVDEIISNFDSHIRKNWSDDSIIAYLQDYDKNILVFLNEYLYSKLKGKDFDFSENVNVEHIMPASGRNIDIIRKDANIEDIAEFTSIVNKLGNKILLEEDINKSISNEWFKTKKQNSIHTKTGYKDSRYEIASALTTFPNDIWTKDDILEKTSLIAKRIKCFIFNEDI